MTLAMAARTAKRVVKSPERRRGELLDAARRLLLERGIEQLTVGEITTAAGTAKGTFYVYFSSKNELLSALRDALSEDAVRQIEALPLPTRRSGWRAYTDGLVRLWIEESRDLHQFHDLITRLPHGHGDPPGDRIRDALCRVIVAGVAAGAYRTPDVDVAADILYELLHSAGHGAAAHPEGFERTVAAVSEFVRSGLLDPSPHASSSSRRLVSE